MPVTKNFKTIDEQIAILDSRQLKFKNKKKAAELLSRYNYFDLINGFESILLKKMYPKKSMIMFISRILEIYFSLICA